MPALCISKNLPKCKEAKDVAVSNKNLECLYLLLFARPIKVLSKSCFKSWPVNKVILQKF